MAAPADRDRITLWKASASTPIGVEGNQTRNWLKPDNTVVTDSSNIPADVWHTVRTERKQRALLQWDSHLVGDTDVTTITVNTIRGLILGSALYNPSVDMFSKHPVMRATRANANVPPLVRHSLVYAMAADGAMSGAVNDDANESQNAAGNWQCDGLICPNPTTMAASPAPDIWSTALFELTSRNFHPKGSSISNVSVMPVVSNGIGTYEVLYLAIALYIEGTFTGSVATRKLNIDAELNLILMD